MNKKSKIVIILIVYSGLLISYSQCQTKKISKMNIIVPEVSKEIEKLEFDKNYDSAKDINSYTLTDGSYIELEKEPYGYIERTWAPDSYFIIVKQFYENGYIKEKGVIFNYGYFEIGNWYYFDENGKLLKVEDCNIKFKFSFHELFEVLQKRKIPLTPGHIEQYTGPHTSIEKHTDSNKSMWVVSWLKEPQVTEEIYFDGNTGKVLKTEETINPE